LLPQPLARPKVGVGRVLGRRVQSHAAIFVVATFTRC
jgi:hypothetical protein